MGNYVVRLNEIERTQRQLAGGKGANLGELSSISGLHVPEGFCVVTKAYTETVGSNGTFLALVAELSSLKTNERKTIAVLSEKIRTLIEGMTVPENVAEEVAAHLRQLGESDAYAVRSSATAEDLPTASFAGQQDTYLNVAGKEEILRHIVKCWASLFTERAVAYRMQQGFGHRNVQLAVIVQKMVFPEASGILFTADPVTSHRKVTAIDAGFGLGEALVSGLVNADHYTVREGTITGKKIATKKLAVKAEKSGGTRTCEVAFEQQDRQVLTDAQIIALAQLGRMIEAHFGCPQDIEWCLSNGTFFIVQSRPVTTLFPVPQAADGHMHVYISVGHQQMMTDAMKPLGISFFQRIAARPMYAAGGRLFVDIAPDLVSPRRQMVIDALGKSEPLIKDALLTITQREDILPPLTENGTTQIPGKENTHAAQAPAEDDPVIVEELIRRSEHRLATLRETIAAKSGTELLDFISGDIAHLKSFLSDPQSMRVVMGGMNAAAWINEHMERWLGEKNAADVLSQSVAHNVTSEMGLALLDVADVIRPYPQAVAFLQRVNDGDRFLNELPSVEGGKETQGAILGFLAKYGMRCSGEIDITKMRWSENPATLVPLLLGNVRNFAPCEGQRRFRHGRQQALQKEQELLHRLRQLPGGAHKAEEAHRMINRIRSFAGYREYPKFHIVNRFFIYRQALQQEAARLVRADVIDEVEDIDYFTFEELRETVRTQQADRQLLRDRKEDFRRYQQLTPPRVITSDGEVITGSYKREALPERALAGLAVSSGTVEGRARVITGLHDADLQEGDILVTTFTDPGWTPLFVAIKALVTEVGGLMTHGAVIAREYGLPAVVGVEHATRLVKDGQRIRVNGTDGYVELL